VLRLFQWLIILLLIGTVLLTALFLFRQPLLSPSVNTLLVEQARTHLGLDIAIGRVSGTYFTGLELTEVRTIGGEPNTPLAGITIGRITIRYSLLSLLTGPDSFLAKTRISLDNAFLQLDIPKNGGQKAGFLLPERLPNITVQNSSIHIRIDDETVELNGLTANSAVLRNRTGAQEVALEVEQAILPFPDLARDPVAIGLRLLYSRESITVESLQIDQKPVVQSAFLELRDVQHGRLAFTVDLLLFEGKGRLQGMVDNSLLTGRLTVRDISLEAFPDFLKKPQFEVGGLVNGQIDFSLDPADIANLTGSLNLQVQECWWRDFAVPQLDLKASLADGLVRLRQLQIKSGGTLLTLHDAAVPIAVLLDGKPDAIVKELSGGFAADSRDIGPVLSAAGILSPEQERGLPFLSLTANGSIKGGYCNLDALTGRLGDNSLDLEAVSFSLADMLQAQIPSQWTASTRGNFLLQARSIQDIVALTGHALPLPETTGLPDHTLTLAGRLQAGTLTLSHGSLHSDSIAVDLQETIITLPHPDLSLENIQVRSDLDLQITDLSQLGILFGLEPVSGSLHGRIGLDGPLARLNGSIHISGSAIQFSTIRLDDLQVRGTTAAGEIIIDTFAAITGEDRLYGHGSFNLGAKRINNLSLQLTIKEIDSYLSGFVTANRHMQGGIEADLEAHGPWSEPEAKLTGRLTAGRYNGIDIRDATVSLKNSGRHLSLTEARFNTSEGNLTFSGNLFRPENRQSLDIKIQALDMERDAARLILAQPVNLSLVNPGTLFVDQLILTGTIGRIEASGTLQPGGNSDLRIRFDGLTGKGWLAPLVADRLYFNGADFTLGLTGDLRAPNLIVQGTVAEIGGRGAPHPFTGTFDVVLDKQGLDFRKFQWTGKGGQSMMAISGRLPFDPFSRKSYPAEALNLTASLELPDLRLVSTMLRPEFAASGSLHGKLFLQGTMVQPNSHLHLSAGKITLPPAIKFLPPGPFDMTCDMTADASRFSFTALKIAAPSLSLDAAGDWLAPPPLTRIIKGQPPLLVGSLDMTASLAISDFSWTARHIEAIQRLDGRLDMEAALSGPVDNPTLRGTVQLADGELRSSYEIPPVRDIQLDVAFETDRININSLTGELGGAPFTATGAVKDYTSGKPTVDLVLKGENLLLYRAEGINIRSDVDLKIQGSLDRLAVSGDLAMTGGRFTRKFDFLSPLTGPTKPQRIQGLQLFSLQEPPLSRAGLDIRIHTKKSFLIKNNLANGFIRPDIVLTGTGELPAIRGTVYLDPIKIKLPSGSLTIESGFVRFTETDPDRPQIDMTGTATIMGYEITMRINGFVDEPTVTLSSSPPLPDDELLLLVLTGTPPKSGAGAGSLQKGTMNIAVYLGRSVLDDWFKGEGTETDDSIMERFELEIGRGITQLGEETIDAQFRLAEGVFRDDDLLFITAQKDVFDAINTGIKIVFRFQ